MSSTVWIFKRLQRHRRGAVGSHQFEVAGHVASVDLQTSMGGFGAVLAEALSATMTISLLLQ